MLKQTIRDEKVGSLLRRSELARKRQAWREERIPSDVRREWEEAQISKAIKSKEKIGVTAITNEKLKRE